ncbi:transcriptional regulator [Labedella gwakjiensis]|uniref:Phosphoenolpyruvate hydrolase family protein n=1 Tax=Labedella gwakjiensis TaxID=390269 RepID=A0A2P8GUR9_9MICO|nr:phosphoenolpyruvate hydrolase family protein [Labedella gwakjiensis]PSL37710.1 transcriptional regulator [Labedella gwakjiensis]RUQ87697.1 phosphoenolpyruvate hydrolase family protein [Labedella gwakjiensis]
MTTRTEILASMRAKIADGRPIIGGGAGTGLSAKCSEEAGLDFIVVYNSGRYRMAGRSSMAGLMPYGDANQIVMDMGSEILPVVDHIPVVAGVCGTDPFRLMPKFLRDVRDAGFSGVQNYPTVCLFEGIIRANLEETGLGFYKEAEMIAEARSLDLFTASYVANLDEAVAMAEAGADVIVPHMGLTTSGMIGAQTALSLADSKIKVRELMEAAREVNPDVIIVCHGGPIASPTEAAEVIRDVPGVDGFLGASSMERLPTETAMIEHMSSYTRIALPVRAGQGA